MTAAALQVNAASLQPMAAADPAAFVEKFASFWSVPSAARMAELLTDDVVLVQPLAPPTRGLAAAQAAFAEIFRWVPDLRAQVDDWCARDARLFIDFRLMGSFGRRHIEWPAIDRINLRGAFATERVSYFDPKPILRAVTTDPSAWLRVLRSGLWRSVLR